MHYSIDAAAQLFGMHQSCNSTDETIALVVNTWCGVGEFASPQMQVKEVDARCQLSRCTPNHWQSHQS